jgi:hypothetical protein
MDYKDKQDSERTAFEKWLTDGGTPLKVIQRSENFYQYKFDIVNKLWSVWYARAALDTQHENNKNIVAWRIFDGEGGYTYTDDEPSQVNINWVAKYGRKYEALCLADTNKNEI